VAESLLYILGILLVAIGVGFSIGWHELGHLIPAKLFGVKVPKYMIGFGPTLFSKKIGETEYGVKLIPLGGYITMIGMYPPAKPGAEVKKGFFRDMVTAARDAHSQYVEPGDENRKFYQLSVWKRIVIMFGGPFMNLVLGTILLLITLSGIGVAQTSTTIAKVAPCVSVSATVNCSASDPASPAEQAGLQVGDRITAINGNHIDSWGSSSGLLKAGVANQITVVSSKGVNRTLNVTPVLAQRPVIENGAVKLDANSKPVYAMKPVIGIELASETRPLSVGETLASAGQSVAQVGQMLFHLPEQVASVGQSTFGNGPRNANGPVSVVGIGEIAGQVASNSQATFIQKVQSELGILASLNFALFAFNLLPLLPLDGGHVAGAIYEAIKKGIFRLRRKPNPGPADTAKLMPLTWVVFIVMMAISLMIIVADIVNPISL
jgi:membrane-associated protease RseP (regulator of RpoE activity)